jgi:hypothetical protein
VKRFWDKVRKPSDEDGCWIWTGTTNNKGYGMFAVETGVTVTAHRYSYKLAHPYTKVTKGMALCILHSCDNRRCVNPKHLRAGTPKRNTAEMVRRGRAPKKGGKAHGNAKLTWQIVRNIRHNYTGKHGERQALCKLYGVGKATMRDLLSGRSWKEVQGE